MKIYDKTPLQNANGQIDFLARVRGTLKYGFTWYPDMEAQKLVIAKLDRLLERGYVLIRNFTLPNSEIIIPIILIGPGGVQVVNVTDVKGFFEAKGSEWNTVTSGRSQPASVNLISRTLRLSRAFQVFLQRYKLDLPSAVEPVLIAANPGAHLEAMRPAVRVVKSDAINAFAATILQSSPVLRIDFIHDLADHIVNPRPAGERTMQIMSTMKAESAQAGGAKFRSNEEIAGTPSRAKAIFNASQQAEPINPSDLDFALRDESKKLSVTSNLRETSPSQRLPRPSEAGKPSRFNSRQVILLAVLALVECCVLGGFGALFYYFR